MGLQAKCVGRLRAPRERAGTRQTERTLPSPGGEFVCPCLKKSNTKLYSLLVVFFLFFDLHLSRGHAPIPLQTHGPPHCSRQDSARASSEACICLDRVGIYRRLFLNWLLIIHLCPRVVPYCICGQRGSV